MNISFFNINANFKRLKKYMTCTNTVLNIVRRLLNKAV